MLPGRKPIQTANITRVSRITCISFGIAGKTTLPKWIYGNLETIKTETRMIQPDLKMLFVSSKATDPDIKAAAGDGNPEKIFTPPSIPASRLFFKKR